MKQILFNTEMVQAILEDRKSQTRRPIKAPGNVYHYDHLLGDWGLSREPEIIDGELHWELQTAVDASSKFIGNLPYQKGNILYVRETWKAIAIDPTVNYMYIKYIADDQKNFVEFKRDRFEKFRKYENKNGNHANIFMPKEAARLFLEVTDVRIERVQDITEKNARNEGAENMVWYKPYGKGPEEHKDISGLSGYPDERISWRNGFATLWDELYFEKGYGWGTNCWVWVIEFERCEKPNGN